MTTARERAERDQQPTPHGDAARDIDWWDGWGKGHLVNRIEELEEQLDVALVNGLAYQKRAHRIIAGLRRAVVVLASMHQWRPALIELRARASAIRAAARRGEYRAAREAP